MNVSNWMDEIKNDSIHLMSIIMLMVLRRKLIPYFIYDFFLNCLKSFLFADNQCNVANCI